jgi:hypothetical protein
MAAGPWFLGEWLAPEGDRIGIVRFGGHKTSLELRKNVEALQWRSVRIDGASVNRMKPSAL